MLGLSWPLFASTFKAEGLKGWERRQHKHGIEVFVKKGSAKPATIATVTVAARAPNVKDKAKLLARNLNKIKEARMHLLKTFGYTDYRITDGRVLSGPHPGIELYSVVGLKGKKRYVLERQYFVGARIYTITYSDHSPQELASMRSTLDRFKPSFPTRMPANEIVESQAPRNFPSGVEELPGLLPPQNCDNVPAELRADPNVPEAFFGENVLKLGGGCLGGLGQALADTWNGAGNVFQFLWNVVTDDVYREQVGTTMGFLWTEFTADPLGLTQRIAIEVHAFLTQYMADFSCYKVDEQAKMVCNALSYLIPSGVLAKIITRSAVTANEIGAIARAARGHSLVAGAVGAIEGSRLVTLALNKLKTLKKGDVETALNIMITLRIAHSAAMTEEEKRVIATAVAGLTEFMTTVEPDPTLQQEVTRVLLAFIETNLDFESDQGRSRFKTNLDLLSSMVNDTRIAADTRAYLRERLTALNEKYGAAIFELP